MRTGITWLLCALLVGGSISILGAAPPLITGIEIEGAIATPLLNDAVGTLAGRPFSRAAVRESVARLWALGQFDQVWAEEVPGPGGVRVRLHVVPRPTIRQITWDGETGLDIADLVAAADLFLGGDAGRARLDRARQAILDLYAREGYFQAAVEIQDRSRPETASHDLTIRLHAGVRARIGAIRVQGSSQPDVERQLKLHAGDAYSQRTVAQRVRATEEALRKEGYYTAHIALTGATWDPATNRVPLDIEAGLGPQYTVSFSGVMALKEATLRDKLSFADAGVVDELETDTSARQIEAAYRDQGYAFAQASGTLRNSTIHFDVTEGHRVTIHAITFSGNTAFPADQLRKKMQDHLPGLFDKGLFHQETLDRDVLVLTAFYRVEGFTDVAVGPADIQFTDDRRQVEIAIPIHEGPRLAIGRIDVTGAVVVPAEDLVRALPFKPGDAWNTERESEARRSLTRLYGQKGYLGVRIDFEPTREDERVNLAVRIREGMQTRVGRILVTGLVETREDTVLRELTMHSGDPFAPDQLVESERWLSELGIFDSVQVGPIQPPSAPFVDIEVTVREGKPWRVEFGGGYSFISSTGVENTSSGLAPGPGWEGFVQVGYENLFGRAHAVTVRELYTQHGDRTDVTYTIPHLFGTRLKGDMSLYRFYWNQFDYKQNGAGISTGVARYLFPEAFTDRYRLTLSLRYDLQWVDQYDVSPSLSSIGPTGVVPGISVTGKVTPSATLDYRDNPFDPKRGSFHTASLSLAGPYFGSQNNFVKAYAQTVWFFDWLAPTTIAVGLRLGAATPYGSSDALPNQDRFYTGGSTSVRGYPQDLVGPLSGNTPLGGNALVIANLEYRFPIWEWLSGVAFVDTGAVAPEVGSLQASDFKTGVGGGLRIRTPIGPIRFDAGYGLNSIPGESRWQFYFAIGQAF